jgi:hypothetical protein
MTFSTSSASPWKRPRVILTVYGLLGCLGLLWAVWNVLAIDSDPRSSILFGLSFQRLILVTLGLFAAAALLVSSLKVWRDPVWAEAGWNAIVTVPASGTWIRRLSLAAFSIGWIILFTPEYRFGDLQAYLQRLHPFLIWFVFFSGLTFLVSLLGTVVFGAQAIRDALGSRRRAFVVALFTILVGIAIMGLSRWLGFYSREDYTYGAGVPVLGLQVLLALGAALLVHFAAQTRFLARLKRADVWVCLLLWALTAALWVREPIPPSYFNPGPYPPNHQYYPFSDAALYDMGSQYVFIGQGLNSGAPFDRPLYLQFLVFIHLAAGQDYENIADLQSAILALFPVFLYLLGKEMAGRPFGFGLGLISTLRGLNTIAAASMIDLGSPKQLLTDFPTALGVAILVYLIVKWLRRPEQNRLFVFWAGGVLGLLSLVRTNAVLLFIPIVILLAFVHRRKFTLAFMQSVILFGMMFLAILPWGIPSKTMMWDVYIQKFRDVIEQRYGRPVSFLSPLSISWVQVDDLDPTYTSPPAESVKLAALRHADEPFDPGFIPRHFFHNLLGSFLILPASPELNELRPTVKEVFPFWQQTWDGSFEPGTGFFLALQFILFAYGLGMAWKRAGLAGLVPLMVFLVYQLTNALGRTSGGRFIVPVDWIVLLYYLLGLVEIFFLVFEMAGRRETAPAKIQAPGSERFSWPWDLSPRVLGTFALFLFIGLSPTITGSLFPVRYSDERRDMVLTDLDEAGQLDSIGATRASLDAFLNQPSAALIYGRALYPRFYQGGRGELDTGYPYLTLPFPRLGFFVIGLQRADAVILPLEGLPDFPNASDVLILGCRVPVPNPNLKPVDALAVFLVQENGSTLAYARQPGAPLQCPVPAIECNENKECRSSP